MVVPNYIVLSVLGAELSQSRPSAKYHHVPSRSTGHRRGEQALRTMPKAYNWLSCQQQTSYVQTTQLSTFTNDATFTQPRLSWPIRTHEAVLDWCCLGALYYIHWPVQLSNIAHYHNLPVSIQCWLKSQLWLHATKLSLVHWV